MSIGISLFQTFYDLGGAFREVSDHPGKAKKERRKMQTAGWFDKISPIILQS
jgi:hypothetical protein